MDVMATPEGSGARQIISGSVTGFVLKLSHFFCPPCALGNSSVKKVRLFPPKPDGRTISYQRRLDRVSAKTETLNSRLIMSILMIAPANSRRKRSTNLALFGGANSNFHELRELLPELPRARTGRPRSPA